MPPVTDGTFAPPPNSHVAILTPDIVVSEAGLGETTRARGRVLTNGVSALNKGTRARAFSVPCEGTVRWPRGTQEEGLHREADHAATFTSRLQKCGKCLFVFEPLSVVTYCWPRRRHLFHEVFLRCRKSSPPQIPDPAAYAFSPAVW